MRAHSVLNPKISSRQCAPSFQRTLLGKVFPRRFPLYWPQKPDGRVFAPAQKVEQGAIQMKTLFLSLIASCSVTNAYDIRETYPGTNAPDMSQPGYHIDRNGAYPTYPGSNSRDWSQPGYGSSTRAIARQSIKPTREPMPVIGAGLPPSSMIIKGKETENAYCVTLDGRKTQRRLPDHTRARNRSCSKGLFLVRNLEPPHHAT